MVCACAQPAGGICHDGKRTDATIASPTTANAIPKKNPMRLTGAASTIPLPPASISTAPARTFLADLRSMFIFSPPFHHPHNFPHAHGGVDDEFMKRPIAIIAEREREVKGRSYTWLRNMTNCNRRRMIILRTVVGILRRK